MTSGRANLGDWEGMENALREEEDEEEDQDACKMDASGVKENGG